MADALLVMVAGAAGVGKTTWIQQKLAQAIEPTFYCCAGAGTVAIDQTRTAAEFPTVRMLEDDLQQLAALPSGATVYIELGHQLDLAALSIDGLATERIAILAPEAAKTEWHTWADTIEIGASILPNRQYRQLWRAAVTRQVIDLNSLEAFWYELTQGAYGAIDRAKGIFDIVEGHSIYGDFVAGLDSADFTKLNLPRWLDDRPQRFSGIEVWGCDLDQQAIGQTIEACCLSEAAIHYYQKQVKASLESLEEVTL